MKQRKQLNPGRQKRQKLVDAQERGIGMRGGTQNAQQLGDELGQDFARPLAAGRADPAVVPVAHNPRDPRWVGKAEPRQGGERGGVVLRAGEDEIARSREARRFLEQLGIMLFDRGEMAAQIGDEPIMVRIAEKGREPGDTVAIGRQAVDLRVIGHLQAVLDPAQKAIVGDQRVGGPRVDAAMCGEAAQRHAGRRHPQLAQPAAPDQLLRLGEELDLADATAPDLDVMILHRDSRAALMRLDLTLDRVDVGNRGKIEMPAPDKRVQLRQKALRRAAVAGHRAGLDQGGAFPILSDGFIVVQRRRHRHRDRRRARVGAQPQVGAKNIAIPGALVEYTDEIAGHAAEQGLGVVLRNTAGARRVVEKDQVDIARIIKLPAAELAHRKDNQAAPAFGILRVDRRDRAAGRGGLQQMAHRRADCGFGKAAERGHLLFERPAPGQLGDSSQQSDAPLGEAQPPHQRRPIFAAIGVSLGRRGNFLKQRVGAFLDQTGQEIPFGDGDPAQERTVAEDRAEQAFAARGCAPGAGERGTALVLRLGKRRLPGAGAQGEQTHIRRNWQPVTLRRGAVWGEMR